MNLERLLINMVSIVVIVIMITSCKKDLLIDKNNIDVIDNTLSDNLSPYYIDLIDMQKDYTLQKAKVDGCIVFENSSLTTGKEIWEAFLIKIDNKEEANALVVHYYSDEDELYLLDISFDGSDFYVFDAESSSKKQYKYLKHFVSDIVSNPKIDFCEYYILVNDNTVTLRELELSIYSSQSTDYIDHYRVYTDFNYYE
jgi:hypothetical protein